MKTILAIDDDEDILSIFDLLFEEEGYRSILYRTGTTVENILLLNPDLILLDVRIFGYPKTGDQICADIKKIKELEQIPVLLVSAELNVSELAKKCKADGYINKPFDLDHITLKIKKLLS